MFKKLLSLLLALGMLLSLSACSDDTVEYPEGWDKNAEFLEFLNGFYAARTADALENYVTDSSDSDIQAHLDAYAQICADMLEGQPNIMDYTYDSVELTPLEIYDGYELFWAVPQSSAYDLALQTFYDSLNTPVDPATGLDAIIGIHFVAPSNLYAVKIEDGRYVTSLDEDFLREVQAKYFACQDCVGQGSVYGPGNSPCGFCSGIQPDEFIRRCGDCGAEAVEILVEEGETSEDDLILPSESTFACPDCDSKTFVIEISPILHCEQCRGSGKAYEQIACKTCEAKGYIKN